MQINFRPQPFSVKSFKYLLTDSSSWFLFFSNLATIGVALWQRWDLSYLLWVYWAQSLVIGLFQFLKILNLKKFSTVGFRINNRPVESNQRTKQSTAWFFAFHYGLFHFVYLFFLFARNFPRQIGFILLISGLFFINHLLSFLANQSKDKEQVKNIGQMMFFPYTRIIPMHLTIFFGQILRPHLPLLLFLSLKTFADLIMHATEHAS